MSCELQIFFIYYLEGLIYMKVLYKIAVNPKRYTGIDRYLKYIIPLAKPVQPLIRY